jgi:nucleoside-diphosphate-sugar epimerase
MRVAVIGANGFIGFHLTRALTLRGTSVVGLVRKMPEPRQLNCEHRYSIYTGFNDSVAIRKAFRGIDCVYHCAAAANVSTDRQPKIYPMQSEIQVIAKTAAEAGVKRFVFLSSVKVNGESTDQTGRFSVHDIPAPTTAYGIEKLQSERDLWSVAKSTGLELVVIRPPLVYGPGVKGNFLKLVKLALIGLPLPLAAIDNKRSILSVENLTDLLIRCADHQAAPGNVFMASDGVDLSTPQLIRLIGFAYNHSVNLFPFPLNYFVRPANMFGFGDLVGRLLNSLQIDMDHTMRTLNWRPPISIRDGMSRLRHTK